MDLVAKFSRRTEKEKWKRIHPKTDSTQDGRDTADLLTDYVTAEAANHSRTEDDVISGDGSWGGGWKKKREPGTAGVIRRKQTNRTRRAQVSTGGQTFERQNRWTGNSRCRHPPDSWSILIDSAGLWGAESPSLNE